MQNEGVVDKSLGNWAVFPLQTGHLFQSCFCIKSLYPVDLESCMTLISKSELLCESVLCYEGFSHVPK